MNISWTKRLKAAIAIFAVLGLAACGGGGGSGGGGGNTATGSNGGITLQGTLAVAAGDNATNYTVFNSYQTSTPSSAGNFSTAVAQATPTYTYAVSAAGDKVYAAVSTSADGSVTIDAQSTAEALVLLNPLLIPSTSADRAAVAAIVKADPAVQSLGTVIASVYGSAATPMADTRISDALTSAVVSVLTTWQASNAKSAHALQQTIRKPVVLVQLAAGGSALQIVGSDLGALTLANSSGSTLQLGLANTGPFGSTTNVDWVVRIVELDSAKVQALGAALSNPASIAGVDSLIKAGGYDQTTVIEGAVASGLLSYIVDPFGSAVSSLGATVFPDSGISLPNDGTYAVIALSGSPNGGIPGTNDLSSVTSSSWKQVQFAQAAGLNVGAIALDVVGTSATLAEASTGADIPIASTLETAITTAIAATKAALSSNPRQISFTYFVGQAMDIAGQLLDAVKPANYAGLNDITWSGLKYFVVNVAMKDAQSVLGVWTGSIDATTRIAEFLNSVSPEESAYAVLSAPSAPADTTPPSTPTGFAATTISSSQIHLSWNASTDNVGVTGYKVYRGASNIASPTGFSYSDTGLSSSAQYCYAVSAFDAAGNESALSSTQCATTQPSATLPAAPTAPTGVSATAGIGQATISWNAVSGATSYNLYMASVTGVTKSNYSSLAGGVATTGATSPYVKTGLTNGTTYYFVVTAVNANGESGESSQVSATPQASTVSIGGTVTGLAGSVVLVDVAGGSLSVSANGTFTLPTLLTSGSAYNVWVLTQPSGQTCAVTGGSGTATANVTSVAVNCTNTTSTGTAGTVTEFSAGITASAGLGGITAGPDGNLWFTENDWKIGRITTAGVITEFDTYGTPWGITAGPDGNLWFTEPYSNRIARITTAGVITEFSAGLSSSASPTNITAGPDGNLWFTEYSADVIGRITPSGVITEFVPGTSLGRNPGVITAGPDGNLWWTQPMTDQIGRTTTAGVGTEFSASLTAQPAGIFAGPDGNLWFTEPYLNRIGRITTAGAVTEFSTGISANAGLSIITAGSDGNLWFTEPGVNRIGRITTAGVVTEFSTGISLNASITSIAAGPDGNLWFTEPGVNRIGRITPK